MPARSPLERSKLAQAAIDIFAVLTALLLIVVTAASFVLVPFILLFVAL